MIFEYSHDSNALIQLALYHANGELVGLGRLAHGVRKLFQRNKRNNSSRQEDLRRHMYAERKKRRGKTHTILAVNSGFCINFNTNKMRKIKLDRKTKSAICSRLMISSQVILVRLIYFVGPCRHKSQAERICFSQNCS